MTNVLRKQAGSWTQGGGECWKGRRPQSRPKYVASLHVVDIYPHGPVQPGAEFLRTAVRGIPFVVRYRRSTVVRAVPPFSAEYWMVTGPDPFTRYSIVRVVLPGRPLRMMMRFRSYWSIIESGPDWNLSSTTPAVITLAFRPSRHTSSLRRSVAKTEFNVAAI